MSTEIKSAVDFYKMACSAEEMGQMDVAEVYYLKSAYAFEQAGGAQILNAANALNTLAFLRELRGNHDGALCAAKKSAQIMDTLRQRPSNPDADLIRWTAWELINDLISYEMGSRGFIYERKMAASV